MVSGLQCHHLGIHIAQWSFEWWEAKRLAVLSERGLDFLDARSLFDGRDIYTIASPRLPLPFPPPQAGEGQGGGHNETRQG
jgi:hypothetical protein